LFTIIFVDVSQLSPISPPLISAASSAARQRRFRHYGFRQRHATVTKMPPRSFSRDARDYAAITPPAAFRAAYAAGCHAITSRQFSRQFTADASLIAAASSRHNKYAITRHRR
jgi:hypothetical protein